VATTAVEPFGVNHSTSIVVAPRGAIAVAATKDAVPVAMTSIAGLTGTPLEVAATIIGAVMVLRAATPGLAIENIGGSSSAAVGKVQT
jgi:hypothetical protein